MNLFLKLFLCFVFTSNLLYAQTAKERQNITKNYDLARLQSLQKSFSEEFQKQKAYVDAYALKNNIDIVKKEPNGGISILYKILEDGTLLYLTTHNEGAAQTINTNQLYTGGSLGLNLNGNGLDMGIWDGGQVRLTHQELVNRVIQYDTPSFINNHATHVSGSMIASGVVSSAKGMAFQSTLSAYDFINSFSEMALESQKGMLLSNHSYGLVPSGVSVATFGAYIQESRNIDNIVYYAPNYLPVFSAGNSNNGNYNPTKNGYDLITGSNLAKNALSVANVLEVTNYTGPSSVVINSSSSWGPTDDGRIKPDISAKGTSTYSSSGSSDTSYANSSGTSMSAPSVSGSIALLHQHYYNLNSGYLNAASMKALVIHSAREAGAHPGPDYSFGWGLMDTAAAANLITNEDFTSIIEENSLSNGTSYDFTVEAIGANEPLVASIVWTDIAAEVQNTADDSTPRLINDLDLRITSPDGVTTYFPWKLDLANPSFAATNADNTVDNVEKIEIPNAVGDYTISVSHKGTLLNSSQNYSIIVSGITKSEFKITSSEMSKIFCDNEIATFDIDLNSIDTFSDIVNFSTTGLPVGLAESFSPSSLSSQGTTTLSISNLNNVSVGIYPFSVIASDGFDSSTLNLSLEIQDLNSLNSVVITSPTNAETQVSLLSTLNWQNIANADLYEVQLSTDDLFNSIIYDHTTENTQANISHLLNLGQTYYWRVRPINNCVSGVYTTANFTTENCLPVSIPYVEDFESGFINPCWDRTNSSASLLTSYCGTNSGGFLQINGGIHTTETQRIDVSAETSIDVSWEIFNGCKNFSEAGEILNVDYWDGSAWQNIVAYDPANVTSSWTAELFTITTGLTANFKLRFDRLGGTNQNDDLDIDNLIVKATPTCREPFGLLNNSNSSTTADFSWNTEANANDGYEYVVMNKNVAPDTNSAVDSGIVTMGTNVQATGLLPSGSYDFFVRSICSVSEKSDWSLPFGFKTAPANDDACNAIAFTMNVISNGDAFTLESAKAQINEPDTNLSGGVDGSVWFSFVAPPHGNVQVSTDILGGSLRDSEIAVYSYTDCSDFSTFTQIGFDQNGGNIVDFGYMSVLNLYDLNPSETYLIQVDRWNYSLPGSFGIKVIDLSYVYNGLSWSPAMPGGNTTKANVLVVENGIAPMSNPVTAKTIKVESEAILELNADLTADIEFKSDALGTAQLGDATGVSINGEVTVERFIPAQTQNRRAFRFLTSAVNSTNPIYDNWQESGNSPAGYGTHITGSTTGSDGFDATQTGNPSMFTFNNAYTGANQDNAWVTIPNTDTKQLIAGEAYLMLVRGDRNFDLTSTSSPNSDVTLRAKGALVTGNHIFNLSDKADYFSLVGNPYQAIVNFNNLNKTNINTAFYWVWDPNMATRGAYIVVDLSNGNSADPSPTDGTPTTASSSEANGFVMPGQSLFVQTLNDGPASLTFTESAKAVSENPTAVFSESEVSSIHLLLYTTQALANTQNEADALTINFSENANNNVDQFDADKLTNPNENLARLNNTDFLGIENRALPVEGENLALYTAGYSESSYTFIVNLNNFPDNVNAFLVDDYSGNQNVLIEGENQINFSVDANIPESIATDRFSISFENSTLNIDENSFENGFSIYPNPTLDGRFTIKTKNQSGKDLDIKMYNMLGQEVLNEAFKIFNGSIKIDVNHLLTGVYIVKFSLNNQSYSSKLIVE